METIYFHFPYQRYIQALILQGQSIIRINDRLKEVALPYLDEEDFFEIKAEVSKLTMPYALKKFRLKPLYDHLNGHRKIPLMDAVMRLAKSVTVKDCVNILTLKRQEPDKISNIIKDKFDIFFSDEDIKTYLHYFWDLSQILYYDLEAVLSRMPGNAYKTINQIYGELSHWLIFEQLGLKDYIGMLKDNLWKSYIKLKELLNQDVSSDARENMEVSNTARNYHVMMLTGIERLRVLEDAAGITDETDNEIVKKINSLRVVHQEQNIPSLEEATRKRREEFGQVKGIEF